MKTQLLKRIVQFIIAFVITHASYSQVATFEPLGFITNAPNAMTFAYGISNNGEIVVGASYSIIQDGPYAGTAVLQGFRWENGEIAGIGMLPTTDFTIPWSFATDISADGSTIVGYSMSDNAFSSGWEAVRWSADGQIEALGDLVDTDYWSESKGVSGDGSVVVGLSYMIGHGFRWENGVLESLSTSEIYFSNAGAISDDGTRIIGTAIILADNIEYAAILEEGNIIEIAEVPIGGNIQPLNISGNGLFVVGEKNISDSSHGFIWSESDGFIELESLGGFTIQALAVSDDGSVVVGWSQDNLSEPHAFIWTEENGTQKLQDVLENTYGLELPGWTLTAAIDITPDGKTIIGDGINPQGQQEGWRIVLPATMSSDNFIGANTQLYPNPTTGVVFLETEGIVDNISVYNISGQKITTPEFQIEKSSIDLSDFSNGLYFVEVVTEKGKEVFKVIKK